MHYIHDLLITYDTLVGQVPYIYIMYIYVYTMLHTCTNTYTRVCVYIYSIHTHKHTHTYIYIYICICKNTYTHTLDIDIYVYHDIFCTYIDMVIRCYEVPTPNRTRAAYSPEALGKQGTASGPESDRSLHQRFDRVPKPKAWRLEVANTRRK